MKLIYRGLSFDYNPAKCATRHPCQRPQTSQVPYELIYRGNKYRVDPNAMTAAPIQPVTYKLIYRAITYWVNRNEQGKVTAISTSAAAMAQISQPSLEEAVIS